MCGVPVRVSWNERDKYNLALFLQTQSGARFIHMVRNASVDVTQKSVWDKGSPERARGYQELFNLICVSAAYDPLRLVEHDSQVSLTDPKRDTSETQEDITDESSSEEYGYNGSSIGSR
jgi:hypothetical protein